MTPDYQIFAQNQPINFQNRLLSLRVTDEVGLTSDTLEIVLDDTDGKLALPRTGLKLQVSLGYKKSGLTPMGQFVVNEIICEGPPQTLHIRAHAADFKQSLKVQTERSWHATTIGDLVKQIADKHGYVAKVAPALAQQSIPHLDQTGESDIHLLTRLGQQYNAIAKPAGGTLLFMPQNLVQSVSGKVLSSQTIHYKDVSSWSYTVVERDNYDGVSAQWTDVETGTTQIESVGFGTHILRNTYANKTDAMNAAQSFYHARTLDTQTANITVSGRADLRAEIPVTLAGFRAEIPTDWIINRAEHSLDSHGYRTSIELVRHLKEIQDETSPKPI